MCDVVQEVKVDGGTVSLPFDIKEVVDNLRGELYPSSARNEQSVMTSVLAGLYYYVRPFLPVGIRKHLQRMHLRDGTESLSRVGLSTAPWTSFLNS